MPQMVRTFIAAHIPDNHRRQIGEFQQRLKRFGGDIRWVKPESIHITLKFLGEIDIEMVDAVADAVGNACMNRDAFEIQIVGCGSFPNQHRPRVLWMGIKKGGETLSECAKAIEENLVPLGFKKEKRSYTAHLTLGRVKSPRGISETVSKMMDESFSMDPFVIDSFSLMQSDLQKTGAVYTALRHIKLQG